MKIYLAGPDVFRSDAVEHGRILKNIAREYGLEGMYPFDNEVNPPNADNIFQANFDMIKRCDAVIANISPFRGPGMDAGTAWEIGAAVALGKKVYLYSNNLSDYKSRVESSGIKDTEYPSIEDFGLAENLMITCSGKLFETFEEAVLACRTDSGR